MTNEKRLIDANALMDACRATLMCDVFPNWANMPNNEKNVAVKIGIAFKRIHKNAQTVDAVEAEKYKALLEMYNELRENFVDFVCSGTPNVAPYCLNRCDGCCDAYGWCRQSTLCQGFNPAEVILDGEKMDGDQ